MEECYDEIYSGLVEIIEPLIYYDNIYSDLLEIIVFRNLRKIQVCRNKYSLY